MAFPTSPTNGEIATVNDIDYIYNSTVRSWTRLPASAISLGNLTVTGNIVSGAITPSIDNTGFIGNTTHTWANGQFTNLTVDSVLSVRAAIDLADNDILRLGSGDDWEFFHNGADNYIDLNVGDLRIRDNTTQRASFSRTTGNLVLDSVTEATSTTTGALVVSGGAGIAGNIRSGGNIYSAGGYYWSNGAPYGSSSTSFSTIAVTDQSSIVANAAGATLNVTGSGGIRILTDAVSDTVEVTTSIASDDYGLITDTATVTSNLGLVTELVSGTDEFGNLTAIIVGTIDGSTIWSNSIPGTRLVPGTDINVGGITANTVTASNVILTNLQVLGAFSANLSTSNLTVGSNLTVTGSTPRIRGDFSNATLANRVSFQTTTVNGATALQVIPNGTGVQTQYTMYSDSAVTNGNYGDLTLNNTEFRFRTSSLGTGTPVPMTFHTSAVERMRIDATSGNITIAQSAAINGLATITGNVTMSSNVTISRSLGVGTAIAGNTGEIRATNFITAFYSDKRLKSNVEQITNALDKVEQLTGFFYTQNTLAEQFGYRDYSLQVGLFAQDVQKVLPPAVKPAPFDIGPGGSSVSGQNYLTIQYEKVIPLLVEAIKELRQEINQLKGQ